MGEEKIKIDAGKSSWQIFKEGMDNNTFFAIMGVVMIGSLVLVVPAMLLLSLVSEDLAKLTMTIGTLGFSIPFVISGMILLVGGIYKVIRSNKILK